MVLLNDPFSYQKYVCASTGMQGYPLSPAEPRALPLDQKLLPQYMKDLGYRTHLLGKWHLGYYDWKFTPLARGFDTHFGYMNGFIGYYDHHMNVKVLPLAPKFKKKILINLCRRIKAGTTFGAARNKCRICRASTWQTCWWRRPSGSSKLQPKRTRIPCSCCCRTSASMRATLARTTSTLRRTSSGFLTLATKIGGNSQVKFIESHV